MPTAFRTERKYDFTVYLPVRGENQNRSGEKVDAQGEVDEGSRKN